MTIPPPNPDTCTEINAECTIEGTLYGYYPSMGANAFFVAFFALCLICQIGFGIKGKTWTYMIALVLGCVSEAVGYAGRIMMNNDPFSEVGFNLQICLLIIAPAFVSAGIYLTLKHIVLSFGESWSRLRPAWYTYIFITGDFISLALQGAGGGLAATAENGDSLQDVGTNLMIAGVIFQVVILSIFAILTSEYAFRTYKRRDQLTPESLTLLNSGKFKLFCGGIITAFFGIFIRCIYRIPELTGGWRSELMRNETEFIVLEGVMLVISVAALTIFHPTFFFPALGSTFAKSKANKAAKSMDAEGGYTSDEAMQMMPQRN